MLAFEVYQDGNRICTAGTGQTPIPVLSVCLDWHRNAGERGADLAVFGLKGEQHFRWYEGVVPLRSEVRIRVVDVPSVDEPLPPKLRKKPTPKSPEEELRLRKDYVRW